MSKFNDGSNVESEHVKLIKPSLSDEDETKSNFDVNKYLKLFADDVGCKIYDIASSLQNQPNEIKEQNWHKLGKKDELTAFVDIYRIMMGLIAYTLITKQMTNKPSINSVKALTLKLLTKLPKYNDKPILTKFEYMNTLHNLLYQIHEEEIVMGPETTLSKECMTNSSPKTGKTQKYVAMPQEEIDSDILSLHLQVGTICTCLQYENDGIDYEGKQCVIKQLYDNDFGGYFVEFTNCGLHAYITADKLKLVSVTQDTETIDMNTVNDAVDEDDNKTVDYVSVCYEKIGAFYQKLPAVYRKRWYLCACTICMLVLVGICSWAIYTGNEMMRNGKENADDSEMYMDKDEYNRDVPTQDGPVYDIDCSGIDECCVVIFSIVMVIGICCCLVIVPLSCE